LAGKVFSLHDCAARVVSGCNRYLLADSRAASWLRHPADYEEVAKKDQFLADWVVCWMEITPDEL
jgi:hypothetical protein